jgi:hypothetical protein
MKRFSIVAAVAACIVLAACSVLPPTVTTSNPTATPTTMQVTIGTDLGTAGAISTAIGAAQPGTPWGTIAGVGGAILLGLAGLYTHQNVASSLSAIVSNLGNLLGASAPPATTTTTTTATGTTSTVTPAPVAASTAVTASGGKAA